MYLARSHFGVWYNKQETNLILNHKESHYKQWRSWVIFFKFRPHSVYRYFFIVTLRNRSRSV